jgi:periplasmic protein TonB
MFETAVVRTRVAHRRYSWLTISLAAHTTVVAAVLAASLASIHLPDQAPRLMVSFIPTSDPPPPPALGTPHATPAPPRPRASAAVAMVPIPVTAPTVIPDTIVPAAASASDVGPETTVGLRNASDVGTGTQPQSTAIAPDASVPLPIGNGVKSPIVLHRVDPIYPQVALRARMNGSVVLECIIDKSGRIRDVRVENSSFAAFEQPAIDAVRQWIFAPGTLKGQAVDTIFQLTVKFQVK